MRYPIRYALVAVAYALVACAYAVPISYTYTGVASGSLGGVPFNNAPFTILLLGDTNGITHGINNALDNPVVSSVRIAGFQAVSFSANASQFSIPPAGFGIHLEPNSAYLYFASVNSLTYNLADPFGYTAPMLGSAVVRPDFPTSGGPLTLIPSGSVSFVAALASFSVADASIPTLSPVMLAVIALSLAGAGYASLRGRLAAHR